MIMDSKKELPKRKNNRLQNYDYSSCGAYFITICTANRQNYFWNAVGATIGRPQDIEVSTYETVGATIGRPQEIKLSPYGEIVNDAINNISAIYPAVSVEEYVIMPDHIHMLILIHSDKYGRPMVAPTMSSLYLQKSIRIMDIKNPHFISCC